MNNLKFYKDGQSKVRSQKAIHNGIKKLYRNAAKEIQKEIDNLPAYQQHGEHINRRRLAQLQQQVNAIIDNIGTLEEEIIKDNLYTVADNTIGAQKEWLQELGFKKDALDIAFSNVPQRMVEKMVSGQIYEGGWNLSDAIWQDKRGIKVDLYTIVAQGLVQQDGILEIAQRLERYVNPNKLTMWNLTMTDGRKIFRKKVDYNSQRLARTLVQHGYQQNVIDSTKDNPFINHWVWRATGSRACDICQKLDGTVYTNAEDIPMDHPNGMCTIEVADDPNMVDKLADWINGEQGDFPEIDAFAETLGYTGDNVHDIIDIEEDPYRNFDTEGRNYIHSKDNRWQFDSSSDKWWSSLTEREKSAVRMYTGASPSSEDHFPDFKSGVSYRALNEDIRNDNVDRLKAMYEEYIKVLDNALSKHTLRNDTIFYRGISNEELNDILNKKVMPEYKSLTVDPRVVNSFSQSGYSMEVRVPKEAEGGYIGQYSNFRREQEFLLGRGTKVKIVDYDEYNRVLHVEVVGQIK